MLRSLISDECCLIFETLSPVEPITIMFIQVYAINAQYFPYSRLCWNLLLIKKNIMCKCTISQNMGCYRDNYALLLRNKAMEKIICQHKKGSYSRQN